MERRPNEVEDLVKWYTGRCVDAARDGDKERFVDALVDYNSVIQEYFDQREQLGSQANSVNGSRLERLFGDKYVQIYTVLLNEPGGLRTEIISAIITSIRRARDHQLTSAFDQFISVLNRCYKNELRVGRIDFDLKRFFVRRYRMVLSKSIDKIGDSDSEAEFESAKRYWEIGFERSAELLKELVEQPDVEAYSHLVSEFTDFTRFDIVSARQQALVEGDGDASDLLEQKAKLGRSIEADTSVLAFVLTGWAFKKMRNRVIDQEAYQEVSGATESERSSITDVAETYYSGIRAEGRLGFWEEWNLNEAMEETMGVATSAPAAISWLREFYCMELLRIGSQSFEGEEVDLNEDAIPVRREIRGEADSVRNVLSSFQEDSTVEELIDSDTGVESLVESLVELHEVAEEKYQEQVREEIRASVFDPEKEESFIQEVQSGFVDSCQIRTVLRDAGLLSNREIEDGQEHEFGRLRVPKRALVSVDDVPLHVSTQQYVNPIRSKYLEMVLEEMNIDEEVVGSRDRLVERVREFADTRDLAAIFTDIGSGRDIFEDEDRYRYVLTSGELVFDDQVGTFSETPVLSTRLDEYDALVIFSDGERIVEGNPPGSPLNINVDAAIDTLSREERSELSEDELENVKDWAYAEISYPSEFNEGSTIGVALTIEKE